MPTNLAIDDVLLEKALAIGGHRTKRETVNEALKEYISRRKRLGSLWTFGTIDFDRSTTTSARGRKGDPSRYHHTLSRVPAEASRF